MTRKALLVASPNAYTPLPGARRDLDNFRTFLKSNAGGAWDDEEIITLIDPSKAQLLLELIFMKSVDYAFVTFSGHGSHVVDRGLSETRICLTSTVDCSVQEINPQNERHFVVIDACRAIVNIELLEERQNLALMTKATAYATRTNVRAAFDQAVRSAEAGRVVAYSCQIDQAAGEDATLGGIFSSALISKAGELAMAAKPCLPLSISDVFDEAARVTYERNAPQRPQLEAGRRLRHFPFAIGT